MPRRNTGEVLLFLYQYTTSALEGGAWSAARPGRFNHLPRKEIRYLSYIKLGFCRFLSWMVRKNSTPPGFKPRTPPHQEASCYTDCAVPVAKILKEIVNTKFKNNIYYSILILGFICNIFF